MTKKSIFWALARGIAAGVAIGLLAAGCSNPAGPDLSNDATLKALSLSDGVALSPGFASGTTAYTAEVDSGVSSVTVTAEPSHPDATVVNSAAAGQDLDVGDDNTITITVTAPDGTSTKTYTITVTRRAVDETDARLRSLVLSSGNLNPDFNPDHLTYAASVNNTVDSITATAQAAQEGATVDNSAAEGQSLDVGDNTITITVTAADEATTTTYTITVTRQEANYQPSNDATLASLSLSGGAVLSPDFVPETTGYTAAVDSGVSSITATFERGHPNATVTVNGSADPVVSLDPGSNTVTITVTAEDGTSTKTYTITVTRPFDARLGSLGLSHGNLNPDFNPDHLTYAASVNNTVEAVTVTAQAAQEGATVDNPAATGQSLTVGDNTITITVTAVDGKTAKTYTITVTRQEANYQPSNDATLASLSLSDGAVLSPAFASGTTGYTAAVDSGVSSVTATAEPTNPDAEVVNSAADGQDLDVGDNTITITVTAEDGTTTKIYTITVTRAPPLTAPPAPVVRVKEGSGKLTVEWDPEPSATAYEVWYYPTQGSDKTPLRSGGDISGTSHVITGLSSYVGTASLSWSDYTVQVYAKNSVGTSPAAEWDGEILRVVTSIQTLIPYDGRISIVPSPYVQHQNIEIRVNFMDNWETAWEAVEGSISDSGNTREIIGLTNGRTYYFWIRIVTDAGGAGDWSPSFSGTPRMSGPTIAQLIPGDESIEVSWAPASSTDSYPISYELWCYDSAAVSPPETPVAEDLRSSPYLITGLENGTEYAVYIKAKTQYDAVDSAVKKATPRPVPAKPDAPALTPGIGQIAASWEAASDTTVISYEIYYHTENDYTQAKKYGEILVPGTSVVIKGLAHNATYYVWLRAKNNVGSSPHSAPASGTPLASGAITVGLEGGLITVKDGNGTDVSGGFVLGASGSITLSADAGLAGVNWHVDSNQPSTGNSIALNGALYNDHREHSVTVTCTIGGILYSSDPIPFQVTGSN
jgi:VCBS repeat-containing protein